MTIGKITPVAILLAAFALGSCSKDDENEENNKKVDDKEVVNIVDGHEYVDLGLSSGTLWATCNVGANSPEEYGDYFAWGETEPNKDLYDWSTYKWWNGSEFEPPIKYGVVANPGKEYNVIELAPEDDAATANWGKGWCMPTLEQIEELHKYTKVESATQNGVSGLKITGRTNGKSIFLPHTGWRDETGLNDVGSYGLYWSRSANANGHTLSYAHGSSAYDIWSDEGRYMGLTIRPVCSKKRKDIVADK